MPSTVVGLRWRARDALGGKADLSFLTRVERWLVVLRIGFCMRFGCGRSAVAAVFRPLGRGAVSTSLGVGWGVGHAEVGADDLNDALPVLRIVLGEALKGVETGEAYRSLV